MPDDSTFLGVSTVIWWLVLLVFVVIFATYTVRKVVEGIYPRVVTRPFWRERFLPLFPIFFGAGLAFALKDYTWPEGIETKWHRILLGFVLGGASGWIFKIVKAKVKSTWGVDIELSGAPLPPGTEVNVQVSVPKQDKPPVITTKELP